MNATVRDISQTGISFYCKQRIYEGIRINLKVKDNLTFYGAKVVRVRIVKTTPNNPDSFIIGASFTQSETDIKLNAPFLKWIDSLPRKLHVVPLKEERSSDRIQTNITLDVTIPAPKVIDNQFHLLSNGIHCTVDQYIPIFHEITVIDQTPQTPAKTDKKDISGVVVRCTKLNQHYYSLDVFFPSMPTPFVPYSDIRIAL